MNLVLLFDSEFKDTYSHYYLLDMPFILADSCEAVCNGIEKVRQDQPDIDTFLTQANQLDQEWEDPMGAAQQGILDSIIRNGGLLGRDDDDSQDSTDSDNNSQDNSDSENNSQDNSESENNSQDNAESDNNAESNDDNNSGISIELGSEHDGDDDIQAIENLRNEGVNLQILNSLRDRIIPGWRDRTVLAMPDDMLLNRIGMS